MEGDSNRDVYNIGNRTNRRLRINVSSSSDQLINNNNNNLNGMSYGTRSPANGTSDEEEAMNYMSPAVTPASSSSKFSWISSSAPNSSTHGGLEEGEGGEDENGAHNYYDVESVEESFDDEHQYIYDGELMQMREPLQSKNYSGHFGSNNNISSVRLSNDDLGRVAYGSRRSLKKAESSWGSFSFSKSMRSLRNFAAKQRKHFDLLKFDPTVVNLKEDVNFQTYTCPRCKTVQREFFSINTYVGHDSYSTNPLIIGTLYLSAYMLVSIYVFGNEEGWDPLDCVYFSVITLTTAGLGDFTPTTDSSKLFAIVFIYIGVAMIGLLLGGLLASSMDDISHEKAKIANEQNCPNCKRIRAHMQVKEIGVHYGNHYGTSRTDNTFTPDLGVQSFKWNSERGAHLDTRRFGSMESVQEEPEKSPPHDARHKRRISEFDVDDVPLPIRGHVRHMSEVGGDFNWTSVHKVNSTKHTVPDGDDSSSGSSSFSSYFSYDPLLSHESKGIEIFQTIRNATMNSLVVIFVGAFGFYLIEESFTVIDSFYFTIVLLTTVGYGDIVPKTNNGKLFATAYVLLGGTLLLGEMSRISMIPLDLRRQRTEAAILKQFGAHLDEASFRELTSGDLIREIRESLKSEAERKLDKKRARGQQSKDIESTKLDPLSCTREEFLIAMFVRLGKVSMDDVQAIMGVFDRLDAGNDGVLNSRDIIFGEIQRRSNTRTMENWERFQRRNRMPASFNRNCKNRRHSSYDRSMGYTNDVYCSSESESQDDQLSYCSYDSAPETSHITDEQNITKSNNMKRSVSTPSFLFFDHLTGDTEGV